MSDANFASLSSTLLARKGGARPAMRPQSAVLGPVDGVAAAANLEDLGWNDMGEDAPAVQPELETPRASPGGSASLSESSLIKKPALPPLDEREPLEADDGADRVVAFNRMPQPEASPVQNQVRESLDRIASQLESREQSFEDKGEEEAGVDYDGHTPAPVILPKASKPAPPRAKSSTEGKRAAFTLRLDQERHLMLRLACTVRGSSAQQLVTDALDSLLAEMPEIAMLAAQVQRRPN